MGRPPGTGKPPEERKRSRSIGLLPAQWDKLDALAAREGMSAADWIGQRVDRAKL
jgi:hypothetical protein